MAVTTKVRQETTLCEDCAARLGARMGAGHFVEHVHGEGEAQCENCGRQLGDARFHIDPDAHRAG